MIIEPLMKTTACEIIYQLTADEIRCNGLTIILQRRKKKITSNINRYDHRFHMLDSRYINPAYAINKLTAVN